MCRWKSSLHHGFHGTACALVLILTSCISSSVVVSAEEVDVWLERRGFTHLLVEHLESQLPSMDPQKRGPVLVRLAQLYAELLSNTDDQAVRIALEERGRRLLEEVRGADAQSLELELCHGAYLGIEQSAERHRLRLLDDAEKPLLIDRLEELIEKLKKLGIRVDKLTEYSSKGLERAVSRIHTGRTKQDVLLEMSNRINYLLGWCLYYQGWLSDDVDKAELAESYFAKVLSLDSLSPGDVSMDLRATAGIGWSIIGMALVSQMVGSEMSAMDWLDLLDEPIVPDEIRSQVPGWRLAILLEAGRFDEAQSFLESSVDIIPEKPVLWIRMAAVHALDSGEGPAARSLASMSLAELASLGELSQLQDIVGRYPDSISGESFPFAYARAVLDYRQAMAMQDAPDTDEMTRREAWMNARKSVELALKAEDVDRFDQARQQAGLLHAWSLYHLNQYQEASVIFESVSEFLPEQDSGEALWMAFVSEERRFQLEPDLPRERADGLIESYLRRFPDGQRVGELKVRVAASESGPSEQRVEELLAVPASSPARRQAEAQASNELYDLFRDAPDYRKKEWASRYLSVAVPIMQQQHASDDQAQISRSVARARRILEVATNPNVLRLVAADNAIEILGSDKARLLPQSESLVDEIEYRKILVMIAREKVDQAMAASDLLYDRSPDSVWARLAARRLLEKAVEAIRVSKENASPDPHRSMVKLGLRVLTEESAIEEAMNDASNRSFGSMVGSSAIALSTMPSIPDEERQRMLELAWGIYDMLLAAEPRNEAFLSARARLASLRGDDEESLRCWRIIAAGSASGSDQWFQARTELLLILEELDPSRASKVLEQHVVLYPGYGPEPWGEILRSLDQRLQGDSASSRDGGTQ